MPLWLTMLLLILATHRVTRFMTRDAFPLIAVPREAFVQRWARYSDAKTREEKRRAIGGKTTNVFMASLAYLWECDWCMSIWVGAGLTAGAYAWTPLGEQHWFVAVLAALVASSSTGLIAQREPD